VADLTVSWALQWASICDSWTKFELIWRGPGQNIENRALVSCCRAVLMHVSVAVEDGPPVLASGDTAAVAVLMSARRESARSRHMH
jgi:hypothetical protein